MIIAASIKQLLDRYQVAYRVFQHRRLTAFEDIADVLAIDGKSVLKAQLLADRHGVVLVVHPQGRKLDFARITQVLNRNFKLLPAIKVNRIFKDCEAVCWPPIGQAYELDVILDQSIKTLDQVYFASGSHTATVQMSAQDFIDLKPRAKILSITQNDSSQRSVAVAEPNAQSVEQKILLDTQSFPALPNIAWQLLQISTSGEHSTKDLIELVSKDPILQQQVLLYTQSPFIQQQFGQTPPVNNVQDVVEHILGFDMVSHIALGVAASRAFNQDADKSALTEFWRHAFYAAAYAKQITKLVEPSLSLDPGISHLAGLFHNFGLLLFSQLFPPEYKLLQKWLELNPKISIAVLEKRLLGMGRAFNIVRGGHAQLGEWLLRHWQLPEAICVIAKEHHAPNYEGKYHLYVKIIQLTNQLLRLDGIGDGTASGVAPELLESLGLTLEQVQEAVLHIKTGAVGLEQMAQFLNR